MPSLSENADSYLDETLNMVYEQAGIIREKPGTWDKPWPVMQNLYDIWEKDADKQRSRNQAEDRRSPEK